MRQILFILIFISCSLSLLANKDRIERPKTYTFIFQNKDTVFLDSPNDSVLKSYTQNIIIRKKYLVEAYLTFKTGETLILKGNGNEWTSIKIKINNREIEVPGKILRKISEIHFGSVALLWNGLYESASAAEDFHIQFDMGVQKSFEKYPYLQFFFTIKAFREANIWRQVDERSTQWSKF
jgi:hypothetical protein